MLRGTAHLDLALLIFRMAHRGPCLGSHARRDSFVSLHYMVTEMRWIAETQSFEMAIDGIVRHVYRAEVDDIELDVYEMRDVPVSVVRKALMEAQDAQGWPEHMVEHVNGFPAVYGLTIVSSDKTALHRMGTRPPLFLSLTLEGDIICNMTAGIDLYVTVEELRRLLEPTLQRLKAKLLQIRIDEDGPSTEWWDFWVRIPWVTLTAAELYELCWRLATAIQFPSVDGLQPEAIFGLLRNGYADNLIGQSESDWLDVKSMPYDSNIGHLTASS
jgi:hypothetical protein